MARHKPYVEGVVYLLHFTTLYKHAGHYIGFTTDLDRRLIEHMTGRGAKLISVIVNAGHSFELARVWEGVGEDVEQAVKRLGGASRICPICSPERAFYRTVFAQGYKKPPRWGWFRRRVIAGLGDMEEAPITWEAKVEATVELLQPAGWLNTPLELLVPGVPAGETHRRFYPGIN